VRVSARARSNSMCDASPSRTWLDLPLIDEWITERGGTEIDIEAE
jgi:hypothetical protein